MSVIGERTCRGCGCTDSRACPGGCTWVLLDVDSPSGICSRCAEEMEWHPLMLVNAGFGQAILPAVAAWRAIAENEWAP